MKQIKRKKR